MYRKELLDCTLRDGGYINHWRFGRNQFKGIISALSHAGIDYIETGFIDERSSFNPDCCMVPDSAGMDRLLEGISDDFSHAAKSPMLLAMIDYGTCSIDRISPQSLSSLDGIRVMFRKELREAALDYCGLLKAKGYHVFVQPVSITSYYNDELSDLLQRVRQLDPYAFYIVDTYGLLQADRLLSFFTLIEHELGSSIHIGYHGHNTLQLAYANSMLLQTQESTHNVLVDGSLYGMGRRTGNAPIELLALSSGCPGTSSYDPIFLAEAIQAYIRPYNPDPAWGYQLPYYIAAAMGCHPEYARYFLDQQGLSVRSVFHLLETIKADKKLVFDPALAKNILSQPS